MSIIRIGLSETEKFAEGYEAIFGNKKTSAANKATVKDRKNPAKKKKKTRKK